MLVDANWKGKPRKLLLSAQRSGVFYVIDRTDGQFLLAKPFVNKETWTKGFEKDGTPIMAAGSTPTMDGTKTCPGVRGATNWYAQSFDPQTEALLCDGGRGLRHLSQDRQDLRAQSRSVRCGHAPGARAEHRDRRCCLGEASDRAAGDQLYRRADHGGRLLFHGETGGDFAAVDAKTGQTLWTFRANDSWRASPMTYMVDGRQYVAAMDSTNLFSFALPN